MDLLESLRIYRKEIKKLRQEQPNVKIQSRLYFEFPRWYFSLQGDKSPLSDGIPWLTFGSIDAINKYLQRDMTLFEFGSGGSTIYFAKSVSKGVSIEHDKGWADQVNQKLQELDLKNWTVKFFPPNDSDEVALDFHDPDHYAASSSRYQGKNFKDYVSAIDEYPDHSFDAVIIDGRARNSCAKHAIPKVKPGGIILLDNSEREQYSYVRRELDGRCWHKQEYYGPGPYLAWFWETAIWHKP